MTKPHTPSTVDSPEFDINSDSRLHAHADALAAKPELQAVFQDIHRRFLDRETRLGQARVGARIELGSGVYPLRTTDAGVLAAEVVPGSNVDLLFDAQHMPFGAGSVRTLFLQNVFHHFSDPTLFFTEASRVLTDGGTVIMLEPHASLLGRLLYPRLFATETFDRTMRGWNAPQTGPMEGANQALSDIVFRRDRRLFEAAFPNFQVVEEGIDPSWFRYLASGGLNFRRIAPRWAFSVARRFENRLEHLHRWFGIHHYIVLRNNHPRTNP